MMDYESVSSAAKRLRADGARIVLANGVFDLLHAGHVALLRFAKQQGDILIVAINSDASTSRLKGRSRPIMSVAERVASIASLGFVDFICVFDEDDPTSLIERLRPDVLVKGAEYEGRGVPGSEFVGSVLLSPMVPGVSTTATINAISGPRDHD